MRVRIVTVLPELFGSFLGAGLLSRAIEKGLLAVETITPRDFTTDKHRSVDDTPYGGGSGMVLAPGPLVLAMEEAEAREKAVSGARPRRVLLTPQGEPFTQARARALAAETALTLVCGRYEGVDERARRLVDLELSLGDFVIMGGEVAAMAILEATARLLPGVIGNASSLDEESHAAGWLEYPHYTRPAEFRGEGIPPVLLSGNHAEIARWRRTEAIRRTVERRPDLIDDAKLTDEERALVAAVRAGRDRG